MAQYNRNNWHHIPGIGGIMATGLSIEYELNKIMYSPKCDEEPNITGLHKSPFDDLKKNSIYI